MHAMNDRKPPSGDSPYRGPPSGKPRDKRERERDRQSRPAPPEAPVRRGPPRDRENDRDHARHEADADLLRAYSDIPKAPREQRLHGLNACLAMFARRPQDLRKVWLLESRIRSSRPCWPTACSTAWATRSSPTKTCKSFPPAPTTRAWCSAPCRRPKPTSRTGCATSSPARSWPSGSTASATRTTWAPSCARPRISACPACCCPGSRRWRCRVPPPAWPKAAPNRCPWCAWPALTTASTSCARPASAPWPPWCAAASRCTAPRCPNACCW